MIANYTEMSYKQMEIEKLSQLLQIQIENNDTLTNKTLYNSTNLHYDNKWNNSTNDDLSNYPPVEQNVFIDITAACILIVGVCGNALVLVAFFCRPWGRRRQVLDRIVATLALVGLMASLTTAPVHLYAFASGHYPLLGHLCQMQGFLLNLLCLMGLWSSFILAAERFFIVLSPHEHALTFSLLNLNVILSGILVLLLVEVSGPIYGWAQYTYLSDLGVCFLDPNSRHIFTYAIIHSLAYVGVPFVVSLWCVAKVMLHAYRGSARVTMMSQMISNRCGIVWLCLTVLVTLALVLPYHLLLLLHAADYTFSPTERKTVYWMQLVAATCVYPIALFLIARTEMYQQFRTTSHYYYLLCFDKEGLEAEKDLEHHRQTRLRHHGGANPISNRHNNAKANLQKTKEELTTIDTSNSSKEEQTPKYNYTSVIINTEESEVSTENKLI